MDIQSTLIIQIVADVVLCLAIVLLLLRLRKTVNKAKALAVDDKSLLQFRKLLAESQIDGQRLISTIDESYRKFQELAISLEVREERLRVLIEEIKRGTEAVNVKVLPEDEQACKNKYESIMKFLKEGFSLEEIAERTGIASGEILLIADLEKARQGKHQTG
jgi:hypothetical protein